MWSLRWLDAVPFEHRARLRLGIGVYLGAMVIGAILLAVVLFGLPLWHQDTRLLQAVGVGASLAIPSGLAYIIIVRALDRFDPEPLYALLAVFAWGGIAACGFSAVLNDLAGDALSIWFGEARSEWVSTVIVAPVVEEFWKGVGIWGVFYFLRHEFDGVIDGLIYATFVGLGFATIENVLYYAHAGIVSDERLASTVLIRGVFFPWGHPVYSAMIGITLGLRREHKKGFARVAPFFGYLLAVLLHSLWNLSTMLLATREPSMVRLVMSSLPLWFALVFAYIGLFIHVASRRSRMLRKYLTSEIRFGYLNESEVETVCSLWGAMRMQRRYGKAGKMFVRTVGRLGQMKWHADRAERIAVESLSPLFIQPLRDEIEGLRAQLHAIDGYGEEERQEPVVSGTHLRPNRAEDPDALDQVECVD